MPEIRVWYTYATDVLGYMEPMYKLVLGITRKSTCYKLKESNRFLICPKDTTRHRIKNFKSIYHKLYYKKDTIILPDNQFKIQTCGEIIEDFTIKLDHKEDIDFIKALGPFSPWTLKHIIDYTSGKKVYQEGMKFGTITVSVLRIYLLKESFSIYREVKPRVANQYFNIKIEENILEGCTPIIPNEEFDEILNSIKYIYSLYSTLKSL